MNKEELTHEIESFKKDHIQFISDTLIKNGALDPMVTILAYIESEKRYGIIVVSIPPEFVETNMGSEIFSKLAPQLLDLVAKKGCLPVCFSWSSEAWVRIAEIKGRTKEEVLADYESLPKSEALLIYFESENDSSLNCQKVLRTGKTVDPDGELIDIIELIPDESINNMGKNTLEGRFTNIFKKYKQSKNDNKFREN